MRLRMSASISRGDRPSTKVFTDMGDDFANVVNGSGTPSDALNAAQQSTVTFMKKQGFTVSP
jgi:multiple sugar transport system substrate-binding protein